MGVSLNSTSGRRPAAQFLVKTPLSSAEVGRLYAAETQAEAEESTEIRFIPKETLLEEEEESVQLSYRTHCSQYWVPK